MPKVQVYRQGDVLFRVVPRSEIPERAKKQGSGLIRVGDHGGRHSVAIEKHLKPENRSQVMVLGQDKWVLTAKAGSTVTHGEHNYLKLPALDRDHAYAVVIQRETTAWGGDRLVID